MNKTRKGRNNDRRTDRFLFKYGFFNCMFSAASKGNFDTISWNGHGAIFVQNKSNTLPPREEILTLIRTETPECSLRFLFVWPDNARKPEAWHLDYKTDQAIPLEHEELEELLFQFNKARNV